MKILLLCILIVFTGTIVQAQSATASLYITLTDIQSVKVNTSTTNEPVPSGRKATANTKLELLRQSASQIKKINSTMSEYEVLYKDFYSDAGGSGSPSSDRKAYAMAVNSPKTESALRLVIYQIDPR